MNLVQLFVEPTAAATEAPTPAAEPVPAAVPTAWLSFDRRSAATFRSGLFLVAIQTGRSAQSFLPNGRPDRRNSHSEQVLDLEGDDIAARG